MHVSSMGQNNAWLTWATANRSFESTNYKHKNTGAGQKFLSTKAKCVLAPKPPYLNRIVSYEDDQVVIYHRIFSLIHFPVSNILFAFIFTFNCVLQRHDDATSSSVKLKLKTDPKNIFETGKPHLEKPNMISYHLVVFIQHDPCELRGL